MVCKNYFSQVYCNTIESLKIDLKLRETKIVELTSHIHVLETDPPSSQNKKRRREDIDTGDMNEALIKDKDIVINNLTKEIERLKVDAMKTKADVKAYVSEIKTLKKDAQDKERLQKENEKLNMQKIEADRVHKVERKTLEDQNKNTNVLLADREATLDETLKRLTGMNQNDDNILVNMIEEKLNEGLERRFKSLQDTLAASIEEKMKINYKATGDNDTRSFARTAEKNTIEKPEDFRAIMLSQRNEELVEEGDRAARAGNIIIHGVEENGIENDKTFVDILFNSIDAAEGKSKNITRIGVAAPQKKRPIKVTLKSETDKNNVMQNLNRLKGKDSFKRISVTEDYTLSERKMIAAKKAEVQEKNANEPEDSEIIYKLRGTPKNGLKIRSFKKDRTSSLTKNATANVESMSH